MELLDEDGLVHEAVPIHAGFHITFPLVKVDIMAR